MNLTWGVSRDSPYGSFDNLTLNQSVLASNLLNSMNLSKTTTVFIDKINAADLLKANLASDKPPVIEAVVKSIKLDDKGGKFLHLAEFLATIRLPDGWETVVTDTGVIYKNAEQRIETESHPLKAYFQAIIDREAQADEPINVEGLSPFVLCTP